MHGPDLVYIRSAITGKQAAILDGRHGLSIIPSLIGNVMSVLKLAGNGFNRNRLGRPVALTYSCSDGSAAEAVVC